MTFLCPPPRLAATSPGGQRLPFSLNLHNGSHPPFFHIETAAATAARSGSRFLSAKAAPIVTEISVKDGFQMVLNCHFAGHRRRWGRRLAGRKVSMSLQLVML